MPGRHYPDWESFDFAGPVDGPVAFGADLSPASVLGAYRRGIIPLPAADEYLRTINEFRYEDLVADGTIALVGSWLGDPYQVAWWSPDPRPVIRAGQVHLGRNVPLGAQHRGMAGRYPGRRRDRDRHRRRHQRRLLVRQAAGRGGAVADMAARLELAGGLLIDAQWDSPFLRSLGAEPVPREHYLPLLGHPAERIALPSGPRPARRLLGPG